MDKKRFISGLAQEDGFQGQREGVQGAGLLYGLAPDTTQKLQCSLL